MAKAWCVRHRDGWCRTASQPKLKPRYRDNVKTYCNYWVVLPWDFEYREPDCPECRKKHDAQHL